MAEATGFPVSGVLPWRQQVLWRPLQSWRSWRVEGLMMARAVSTEPVGLSTGIAVEVAGFAAVLAVYTNDLLGKPAPICLSG
ncbi:hypothetical protein TIFTF001_047221 [Ficus carica]|uniref:Uncharacterized protein n=1 Tax=Ficus carica TaxID=3494 RepID=A0AA87YRD7_FICCA|nr:hypothetical protein TIFTF001_047211 [Ficus carica]GMN21044.1 hypothetical protein TIFTF001_047215 [Ficus carica]GMN21063.1 hypothetical protein TIFTF001_047217 [Ficus carica]GMN21075.1 hypothetical protein TIFTF001_047221 [Ficus carica]